MAIANRLLARILRQGGDRLLNKATEQLLPIDNAPQAKRSIGRALAGAALTRIATRSVPGALVVGGGLLAKSLYDRRRARKVVPQEDIDAGD
jgi:hypothetical protein